MSSNNSRQAELWPIENKPNRIFFHEDFDGICSAAILVAFFGNDLDLKPVRYNIKKKWLRLDLHKAAIVDFLYHPDALWWFDHHETTFVDSSLRSLYKPDARHRWDTTYSSCPSLILDVLSESVNTTKLSQTFREWVRWSDIIDSAKYDNPNQAVLGSEPALLINHALSESMDSELRVFLVLKIAEGLKPETVANLDRFASLSRKRQSKVKKALQIIHEKLEIFDKVGFCDLTNTSIPFIRYGIYYFLPEIPYSVIAYTMNRGRNRYFLSLSANPWLNRGNKINLGITASRYGGGGRTNVAAISFASATECKAVAIEIIQELTKMLEGGN